MSNVNYTQFSEEKKVETPVVEEPVIEVVSETPIVEGPVIEARENPLVEEPVIEEIEEPKDVIGFVVNCSRLNVRKEASQNAAVIKIINHDARVKIDEENSTEDFYKVQTGGVVGFCMKEFIEIQ